MVGGWSRKPRGKKSREEMVAALGGGEEEWRLGFGRGLGVGLVEGKGEQGAGAHGGGGSARFLLSVC